MRASLNQDTDQNDFSRTEKGFYNFETKIYLGKEKVTLNHDKFKWGVAGAGSCITGMFGAGVGAVVAGFPGFLLVELVTFPHSTANNFNPNLNYP